MQLFQNADVIELTGLTRSQLREWCGRDRRNLIPADIMPQGPGRHALYTWQTVLVLRLLKTMHTDFAVEIAAWAPAINMLRQMLEGKSFPSLWDSAVYFRSRNHVDLVASSLGPNDEVGLLLPLEPHLSVIAAKLSISPPNQLPLFPAVGVPR